MLSFEMFDKRAVFIDRDGTVIRSIKRDLPTGVFHSSPWFMSELVFMPKVQVGMKLLKKLGFLRILITNQPDVNYGYVKKENWEEIQNAVARKLSFDDIFMCRHPRNCNCMFRKPAPGMLWGAADKHGINLSKSYMIGDTENDTKAGWTAGCRTILIDTKYNKSVKADYRVKSFWGAVRIIKLLESKTP